MRAAARGGREAGLEGFLGRYASKKLIVVEDCRRTVRGCLESARGEWTEELLSAKSASLCAEIERSSGGQSPDHFVRQSLNSIQLIGSASIDSLFIASTNDIVASVGEMFPLRESNGDEVLKVTNSRKWGGSLSCCGITHKNRDGNFG